MGQSRDVLIDGQVHRNILYTACDSQMKKKYIYIK